MRNTRASCASFELQQCESEAKFEQRLCGDWRKWALTALSAIASLIKLSAVEF